MSLGRCLACPGPVALAARLRPLDQVGETPGILRSAVFEEKVTAIPDVPGPVVFCGRYHKMCVSRNFRRCRADRNRGREPSVMGTPCGMLTSRYWATTAASTLSLICSLLTRRAVRCYRLPRTTASIVHLGASIDSMTARGIRMARPNRRTGIEPAEIIR